MDEKQKTLEEKAEEVNELHRDLNTCYRYMQTIHTTADPEANNYTRIRIQSGGRNDQSIDFNGDNSVNVVLPVEDRKEILDVVCMMAKTKIDKKIKTIKKRLDQLLK